MFHYASSSNLGSLHNNRNIHSTIQQHQPLNLQLDHQSHQQSQSSQFRPHSQYGNPLRPTQLSHKRRHSEMETGMEMGLGLGLSDLHNLSTQTMNYSQLQPEQPLLSHHHHLPDHSRHSKQPRYDNESSPNPSSNTVSAVGQPGMPPPAAKPRGPKLKFTSEDDTLLVDLKENKALTWKQIAEFFPGRSSGTLQVRYCTKLKAKTTLWSDETLEKLRLALNEYEAEKWRIVANKVGTGFTPVACKEKAAEINGLPPLAEEDENEEENEEDDDNP